MSKFKRKILIVAEHASAVFGGEALIPFQYFKHLRELGVDVHLLVHDRTQKELREAFPNDLDRLHFVTDSFVNIWCSRIGSLLPDRVAAFTLGAISHLETQMRQRNWIRSFFRKNVFDIVHEPIPVSPKLPSMLFGLSVPVVIGPMNGGMDYPQNYNSVSRVEQAIISALRWTANSWNYVLPGKREAALLLVANERTYNALPSNLKSKPFVKLVENGVDPNLFKPTQTQVKHQNFRVVYVGRLVDWKRVDLLIEACSRLKDQIDLHVDLIGEGPLRESLENQVRRLGLTDHFCFHGRLSQSSAADLVREADVFVLPSMRECGGAVVLEAMASGVPVIATKWGGPAEYITEDTGILISPATPTVFVDELARAMLWLAGHPQDREKMGRACRERVLAFYDWRAKAMMLLKIYEDVVAGDFQTHSAA